MNKEPNNDPTNEPLAQQALSEIRQHESYCEARAKSVDMQFAEVKDTLKAMRQSQFRREMFFYSVAITVILYLAKEAGVLGG